MFFILASIHTYSIFLLENILTWPLIISGLFQCFWEACLIIAISSFIKSYLHISLLYTFKTLLSFFILAQTVDFILIRIMGTTVWHFLYLLSFESASNVIETLKASNVPLTAWVVGTLTIIMILASGVLFYHYTDRLLKNKKLRISYKLLTLLVAIPPLFLFIWDKVTLSQMAPTSYEAFRQLVPFKTTFSSPPQITVHLEGSLKNLPKDNPSLAPVRVKRPPIFLFIIESLRKDFITEEVAPNISTFRDQNISFKVSTSGGNSSHNSWFTIFHSQVPLRFSNNHIQETIKTGSAALSKLKEFGYQVHVYTSAELSFFHMGESIFGKDHNLADSFQAFLHEGDIPVYQSDLASMKALQNTSFPLDEEGHLHIVFLDSTHFDYSWPREEMGDRFTPVDNSINYILTAFSKTSLPSIKNRYKNSIYYVDSLLGNFLQKPELEDAVVIITGDHGEEFYEHGRIFHASNLCDEQISIPLYYKFGKTTPLLKPKASEISSHIDIFPTLFDFLTDGTYSHPLLEGESIFKENRWPYTITSRYNCGQNPFQFCLYSLSGKTIFQSPAFTNILDQKSLQVLLKSHKEESLLKERAEALSHFFSKT